LLSKTINKDKSEDFFFLQHILLNFHFNEEVTSEKRRYLPFLELTLSAEKEPRKAPQLRHSDRAVPYARSCGAER